MGHITSLVSSKKSPASLPCKGRDQGGIKNPTRRLSYATRHAMARLMADLAAPVSFKDPSHIKAVASGFFQSILRQRSGPTSENTISLDDLLSTLECDHLSMGHKVRRDHEKVGKLFEAKLLPMHCDVDEVDEPNNHLLDNENARFFLTLVMALDAHFFLCSEPGREEEASETATEGSDEDADKATAGSDEGDDTEREDDDDEDDNTDVREQDDTAKEEEDAKEDEEDAEDEEEEAKEEEEDAKKEEEARPSNATALDPKAIEAAEEEHTAAEHMAVAKKAFEDGWKAVDRKWNHVSNKRKAKIKKVTVDQVREGKNRIKTKLRLVNERVCLKEKAAALTAKIRNRAACCLLPACCLRAASCVALGLWLGPPLRAS